ncbi:immunity protein [Pseudomonas sp. MG-9]|uniref:Immunity protein n=1 Tax=Pseudomonas serboccidentalis TaxID=2964670 RepID=A0ABY7ZC15_9PSED|nr:MULTISPECIES: immunity protein [Pseudomonas]MBT9266667.1 immunity protein [Pseudomonas sp. MG-9]WDR36353.1 immunity protein [Pseudomonas serboccidentalis]
MSTVEKIIKNEPIAEVISLFALCFHPMRIDQMYVRYRKDTISHGVFVDTYNSLFRDGVLSYDENGKTIKGPNWTPPAFMTEKRYD